MPQSLRVEAATCAVQLYEFTAIISTLPGGAKRAAFHATATKWGNFRNRKTCDTDQHGAHKRLAIWEDPL
jgi:hypothetical protein